MRVCSINLSVLLEKSPFNVAHSRSEIEWFGLLKCLTTGSPLLLSQMLFCDCVELSTSRTNTLSDHCPH